MFHPLIRSTRTGPAAPLWPGTTAERHAQRRALNLSVAHPLRDSQAPTRLATSRRDCGVSDDCAALSRSCDTPAQAAFTRRTSLSAVRRAGGGMFRPTSGLLRFVNETCAGPRQPGRANANTARARTFDRLDRTQFGPASRLRRPRSAPRGHSALAGRSDCPLNVPRPTRYMGVNPFRPDRGGPSPSPRLTRANTSPQARGAVPAPSGSGSARFQFRLSEPPGPNRAPRAGWQPCTFGQG